ncbi:hypothetical protein AgCh_024723 [Apium graveolens]
MGMNNEIEMGKKGEKEGRAARVRRRLGGRLIDSFNDMNSSKRNKISIVSNPTTRNYLSSELSSFRSHYYDLIIIHKKLYSKLWERVKILKRKKMELKAAKSTMHSISSQLVNKNSSDQDSSNDDDSDDVVEWRAKHL